MKNLLMIFSILMFISLDSFAQGTGTSGTRKSTSTTKSQSSTSGWQKDRVEKFVMQAAMGGMMEVQLGKLASQNATSQQVKDFGKLMVKDHSDANMKLKTAVKSMQFTIPSTLDKDHQNKIDKVTKKTGKDFDKEYMDMMVKDHKEDVSDFEQAQRNVTDPSLKSWIDKTLPVLREHLNKAETIQKQLK